MVSCPVISSKTCNGLRQEKTCVSRAVVVNDDAVVNVEAVELLGEIDDMARHHARLSQFSRLRDAVTEREHALDDFVGFVACDCRVVHFVKVDFAALSQRGKTTRISVLHVRCGFAVEIEDFVKRKDTTSALFCA